jgi:SET domain-containing protein
LKFPKNDNQIDAPESDYLYINPSQIVNSGYGLYTAIDIYKGEIIALFKGKILSNSAAIKRAKEGNDRYFINLLNGRIMDSMHAKCFAKFANDANGLIKSNFKNNTVITLDDHDRVCLQALRDINAGEELFCNYGKRYWKKHG